MSLPTKELIAIAKKIFQTGRISKKLITRIKKKTLYSATLSQIVGFTTSQELYDQTQEEAALEQMSHLFWGGFLIYTTEKSDLDPKKPFGEKIREVYNLIVKSTTIQELLLKFLNR